MRCGVCFDLDPLVEFSDAEATLHVAIIAIEGLYGEVRVLADLMYRAEPGLKRICVDVSTETGKSVSLAFTALLFREYGGDSFTARAFVSHPPPSTRGVA